MKRTIPLILILSLGLLAGCTLLDQPVETMEITVTPEAGYPPLDVRIRALGVGYGQFIYEVEGETYEQPESFLDIEVENLPCVVTVTRLGSGDPQEATATIGLRNLGPVIGPPVLNAITDLWTIHPRQRYVVTFPDTYDIEGGPVTLVDVTVYHTGQQAYQAVFCPPYTGSDESKPKPDLYRVRTGAGDILNAFVFHSIWEEYLNTAPDGTTLPMPPPSKGEDGYPGGRGATCPPLWPRDEVSSGMTIITATFEDEMGARTTKSFEIPTMYYPGC